MVAKLIHPNCSVHFASFGKREEDKKYIWCSSSMRSECPKKRNRGQFDYECISDCGEHPSSLK